MPTHRLVSDAKNRAVRTFLQGLLYTALAAVVVVLLPVFTSAKSWSDFHWSVIAFAVVQSVAMAVFAYLMRTVLDPSKVPTPLPPGDPGEPDKDEPLRVQRDADPDGPLDETGDRY